MNPQARKGLIDCLCKLPDPDEERLFEQLVPIGDQGEIDAIVEHYPGKYFPRYIQSFVNRMGEGALNPLLTVLTERRRGAVAAAQLLSGLPRFPLENHVLDQLRVALNDRNADVIVGVIETLVNQGDEASLAQLRRLAKSRVPKVPAAAKLG
jgi:hypothetical protein